MKPRIGYRSRHCFHQALDLDSVCLVPSKPLTITPRPRRFSRLAFRHHDGRISPREPTPRSKGKVEIKVFHSSQLGSDEQMMRGIKVGAPEMFLPSTVMSTAEQKFGVFEMPYLIVSRAHMKKVAENKQVQSALFDGLPAKGMRVLGVWENGFRHITNNVRPIVKPEDLKGIKLRVPGGVWRVKMFKDYGANPSPMPLAEVYSALQSGVMDAQENPVSTDRLGEISGGAKISLA